MWRKWWDRKFKKSKNRNEGADPSKGQRAIRNDNSQDGWQLEREILCLLLFVFEALNSAFHPLQTMMHQHWNTRVTHSFTTTSSWWSLLQPFVHQNSLGFQRHHREFSVLHPKMLFWPHMEKVKLRRWITGYVKRGKQTKKYLKTYNVYKGTDFKSLFKFTPHHPSNLLKIKFNEFLWHVFSLYLNKYISPINK